LSSFLQKNMDQHDFGDFEKRANVSFGDKTLLRQAFTHRSFVNEYRGEQIEHNERLEFLGDAVLELAVTRFLFDKYPSKPEGELTAIRAALVNTNTLASLSGDIGMNDFLLLSRGESRDTGRARQYILANTFEAVIGAIYIDQGFEGAERFIAAHVFPLVEEIVGRELWRDAKSRFQEEAQENVSITPTYEVIEESGPDHDKHFVVAVCLDGEVIAKGEGKSKQDGEQLAASRALESKGW
jgi:ribonuclease III